MPGRNCAVFGCGSCRRTKGIGIWKLPKADDAKHREWRESWLGKLKKTRVIDSNFREQIKNDRVYTCEKHFSPEDFEICEYYRLYFMSLWSVYIRLHCQYILHDLVHLDLLQSLL